MSNSNVTYEKADQFAVKKKTLETKYWLSLLKDTKYIDNKSFNSIHQDADKIVTIFFSISKTTKIKVAKR